MKSNFMNGLFYLIFLLVVFNFLVLIIDNELLVYIFMIWIVLGTLFSVNNLREDFRIGRFLG